LSDPAGTDCPFGAAALMAMGRKSLALTLAVLYVINTVLVYHWHQQKG
jgi:hypothetical protein